MHRVVTIVERYPQLSETYISTETTALARAGFLASLVALRSANYPLSEFEPFSLLEDEDEIVGACLTADATVLHTHYLHMAPLVARIAERSGLPFTVRTHSYDVLKASAETLRELCALINGSNCLGVLSFPFICERLAGYGLREDFLIESWPVIDYRRFLDKGPNGEGVLNLGAALDKKNMTGYVDFAATKPGTRFSLYAVGYRSADLIAYNAQLGSPVDIHPPVQPADMPQVYKEHSWLLYSASIDLNTVGWPMAVAEAQASGVGVCLQSKRDDAAAYLGGAGVVFVDFGEVADLVSGPVPEAMRERGFGVAAQCDVATHVQQLVELWSTRRY